MEPERWRQVQELFHAALESPEQERAGLIAKASQGDPDLAERVGALLDAHVEAPTFVDKPLFRVTGGGELEIPRAIGPYRPLEVVGRGGMGVVYRAVRADEAFEKEVAVKVVSSDLTTPELIARFRAERQILADLEHPGIARLLDGGATEEGHPYLVMEYVDGLPVDRFLVERQPSLETRLELFTEICDAVHSAHQNLIVHRDLKPSNILVTADGRPKLLDFGIAKLLAPSGAHGALDVTAAGARLMTPSYASPEQVLGSAVTTVSDVYALGVVLFEMLTGRHPYASQQALPHELTRAILEQPAPKPSTSVEIDGDSSRGIRGDSRWAKALRGDLDRIVLTALHKEPDRRYPSAQAFAADIERFRRGLPIAARPDSFLYRADKFVRRNRLAVAATLLAFLALTTLTITTFIGQVQAARQRDRAEGVSGFLVQLFEKADPRHARGDEVTARELLDLGAREIGRSQRPADTVADLAMTMGEAYLGLGLYEPAGKLLTQALDHRQERYGDEHPDVAMTIASLGRLRLAEGHFEAAEQLSRAALRQRQSLLGPNHPLTGRSTYDLATLLHRQGEIEAAEALYEQAINILRPASGEGELLARALNGLVNLERDRGHFKVAEDLQREALATMIAARGEAPDPSVALFRTGLGTLLRRQGDDAAAEVLYRQALATQRQVYPEGHADIAITLVHLASATARQGRFDEADAALEEAIEIRLRLLGEEHPLVANALNNRAKHASERGRLESAETHYRQALKLQVAALPDGHKDLATTRSNLGLVLDKRGLHKQAEALHRQALAAYRALYGDQHARVAIVLNNLGESLKAQERYAEAKDLFEESLSVLRAVLGDSHPNIAVGLNNLAWFYRRENNHPAAVEAYAEARLIAEKSYGEDHPTVLRITLNELSLLSKDVDFERAEGIEARVVNLLERCTRALDAGHKTTAEARGLLGQLLLEQNRFAEAETHLRLSLDELSAAGPAAAKVRAKAERRLEELAQRRGLAQ